MNSSPLRRSTSALLAALPLALAACASGPLVDQGLYEAPDERGVQVTQVLLRGADESGTPDELDRVGYNRYARAESGAPRSILVLVPEWGRGAGWLDGLSRDLVAACDGLEVWTLNRRQALLSALAETSSELDFLRRWDLSVAQRDLGIVCAMARERGARLALGGWGLVGGWQAYERAASGADGAVPLFLLDAWLAPANAGERAALASLRAIARAQLEAGALTSVGLDPRVRPSTPGDFGFAEQAAFEAERAPEAESELVERHPSLAKSKRRFTNRGLFAWAFDRPRPRRGDEELAQRGPLASLQGLPFAELERREGEGGPIDDARCGATCGAPYELEEALGPFSAPGGPFEAFAPLIGWSEALEAIETEPAREARVPRLLSVETSTQRGFRERAARVEAPGAFQAPTRFAAGVARRELELDGDELAPLLAAEVRAELVAALRSHLDLR
ncbi:MAG: hypothetical protein IPN34_09070 [Planctomycetes bacterium]|nr:hypothetical protein [Planctomycetota bacterium]